MRKHLNAGMCALASLAFCFEALAIAPDSPTNRYQAIPDRNAFGLKPPPAIDPPPPPPPSIPKLILTGITTVLGNKLVLMKAVVPPGNAPGQAIKEESLMLTEGQRQGNVEVLNIDEKAGSVRVNNSGSVMTLTFEKDGAKLPNTPPPLAPPVGLPLPTNATVMSPATAPTGLPGRGATHKRGSFPTREIRPTNVLGPAQGAVQANPVGEVGSPAVPSVANPAPGSLPAGLTPEEQAIVLQLQQQSASQSLTGAAPEAVVPGAPVPGVPPPVLRQ